MHKIQEELQEYLWKYSARKLREETWIWCGTIYSIKEWHKNKKYTKQTLDTLYEFFSLSVDDFYKDNIKVYSWYEDALGVLFKTRREKLGLSKNEVAKQIKWTERHLTRIETGDSSYRINSYYLKELLKLYQFTQDEANQIMAYVLALSDIINLSKNENVLD